MSLDLNLKLDLDITIQEKGGISSVSITVTNEESKLTLAIVEYSFWDLEAETNKKIFTQITKKD